MVSLAGMLLVAGVGALAGHVTSSNLRLKEAWKDQHAVASLVALIAFLIGALFGGGASIALFTDDEVWYTASLGVALLSFFHWSEFFLQAVYRPDVIDISSFHLDHSTEYKGMVVFFIGEYLLEAMLTPYIKGISFVTFLGFLVSAAGLVVRCLAMIKAGQNFSHVIEDDKRDDHKLVTTGIYSLVRHPSYAGFFWWSVGMQIMLFNPISLAVAIYGNYRFFSKRIEYEEARMASASYFGKAYDKYKAEVPSGVPFC